MRTITVKEAAIALGITPRAVSYRLEKGQLKGTLSKNEATGVPEWRIYPNKEILSGLSQATIDFAPNDVIDAESIDDTAGSDTSNLSEARPGALDFQSIVEQCVRPLVEEVKAQALALAEKDRIIEDQNRNLRLLPDFQKKAEEERKLAELNQLEAIALKKQIALIDEEKAAVVQRTQAELLSLKEQLTSLEEERLKAQALEARVAELQQSKNQIETSLLEEVERLKAEKEAQSKAVQEQLLMLTATVQDLKKPWWKKLFGAPEDGSKT